MHFSFLRHIRLFLGAVLAFCITGALTLSVLSWVAYRSITSDLPTVDGLRNYQPPVMSRIYASDDTTIAELASERRLFVPYPAIPQKVSDTFIAAEDQKFWSHNGVDPQAIIRAALTDILRGHHHRPVGASTITQQVARIMLLGSNAVSLQRKIKEAALAWRIEKLVPKEKILEIYLNEIYLGEGAYGVASAAQIYFNRSLDQLTNAQVAFLAALPKSPTNYNPFRNPRAARFRRNWVLERMAERGVISPQEAKEGTNEPLTVGLYWHSAHQPGSEWFTEEVRRELIEHYGQNVTMQGGLDVHTSLVPQLQEKTQQLLRQHLMAYEKRRWGWRGAIAHHNLPSNAQAGIWMEFLARTPQPEGMLSQWRLAIILDPRKGRLGWIEPAKNYYASQRTGIPREGRIEESDLEWTHRSRLLRVGDVVMIEPQANSPFVQIRQIPHVEGAVVTLDARTGRVLSLVGGWSQRASQFDRAVQALRQPGSSFKPFVYLQAMEDGISPSQQFDDSPLSLGEWHPSNYEKNFWGPTTLHDALRESRNLVTIRLAAVLGLQNVSNMAEKLGLASNMPPLLAGALGAVETSVLREAAAYGTLASGGRKVTPRLIDDIQDRNGHVIWRAQDGLGIRSSDFVFDSGNDPQQDVHQTSDQTSNNPPKQMLQPWENSPLIDDERPRIASPQSTYQITKMLEDVMRNGTGTLANGGLRGAIAGKTGTSQNFNDAWFAGYTPEIVSVVWIGFDTPTSLGKKETGGVVAGPLWNHVMRTALEDKEPIEFAKPDNISLYRYDGGHGKIVDGFKPGQIPGVSMNLWDNEQTRALDAAMAEESENPDQQQHHDNTPPEQMISMPKDKHIAVGGFY